jgi:hypothetical protein
VDNERIRLIGQLALTFVVVAGGMAMLYATRTDDSDLRLAIAGFIGAALAWAYGNTKPGANLTVTTPPEPPRF